MLMVRVACCLALAVTALIGRLAAPADVGLAVDPPGPVTAGEPFALTIRLTNTTDRPQTLVSLDIPRDDLAGLHVLQPRPTPGHHLSPAGRRSLVYNRTLPAGETVPVTLHAVATRPGVRRTTIEASINADFAFVSAVVRLDVRPRARAPWDHAARTAEGHGASRDEPAFHPLVTNGEM
jgi:hypothetical protein